MEHRGITRFLQLALMASAIVPEYVTDGKAGCKARSRSTKGINRRDSIHKAGDRLSI